MDDWEQLEATPLLEHIRVGGVELRPGDQVRLRPFQGGDIFDLALAGKIATIEAIMRDYEEKVHLAVTIDDDPGRDLGKARQPGHQFFFSPLEVEPLGTSEDDAEEERADEVSKN